MMTWTVNNLTGHWLSACAVVSAETVEMAIIWLEKDLKERGLEQTVTPDQMIPMVTSARKVRILSEGDY